MRWGIQKHSHHLWVAFTHSTLFCKLKIETHQRNFVKIIQVHQLLIWGYDYPKQALEKENEEECLYAGLSSVIWLLYIFKESPHLLCVHPEDYPEHLCDLHFFWFSLWALSFQLDMHINFYYLLLGKPELFSPLQWTTLQLLTKTFIVQVLLCLFGPN